MTGPHSPEDWMRLALALAGQARDAGEVPVGAVLSDASGQVLAEGRNRSEAESPLRHAEMEALTSALRARDRWSLGGSTLYVTAEPCLMCLGAMVQARIGGLVYACAEPRFGGVAVLQALWKEGRYPHRFPIICGLLEEDARGLLRDFFARKRDVHPSG
jgi:tRNA(adenine34) deaminase